VHQLFEKQAAKTPRAVAVVEKIERPVTRTEPARESAAHYLTELGIGPEVRVAVCMERGLEMLVGILGVLKAGGACVPLDSAIPAYGEATWSGMPGLSLCDHDDLFSRWLGVPNMVADLEEAREEIEKQSGDNLNVNPDAENLPGSFTPRVLPDCPGGRRYLTAAR